MTPEVVSMAEGFAAFRGTSKEDIKARVAVSAVVASSGIVLKRAGHEMMALCPFHNEKSPSFAAVDKKRFYHCHGCGAHGDIFSWLENYEGLSFAEAFAELAAMAGLAPAGYVPQRRTRSRVVAPPSEPLVDETALERQQLAIDIWRDAVPAEGTAVEAYLRSRCLLLGGQRIAETIRFHSECPETLDGDGKVKRTGPAMVAAVAGEGRRFVALHRTFIQPDGSAKRAVAWRRGKPVTKKMLGPYGGGAVRLAPAGRHMHIAEGIESTMAVELFLRAAGKAEGAGIWAALSLDNLARVQIPAGVRAITIWGETDFNEWRDKTLDRASVLQLVTEAAIDVRFPPMDGPGGKGAGIDWCDGLVIATGVAAIAGTVAGAEVTGNVKKREASAAAREKSFYA